MKLISANSPLAEWEHSGEVSAIQETMFKWHPLRLMPPRAQLLSPG